MATRNAGTTTVTMLAAAPAPLANSLGLTGGQNTTGQVLALPHRDALALVRSGVAKFGSAARDAARTRTNVIQINTHAV